MRSSRARSFRRLVYTHYETHGRKDLPWRKTRDPYRILVSEMMLQQTQVPRVIDKYREFIRRFPGFDSLAKVPFREVLEAWSGLGYNRRAKYLHETARIVVNDFGGRLPPEPAELEKLPGIGRATARSIAVFAFGAPVAFIETNIRAVFIHHFFAGDAKVRDAEILPLVERMLDRADPSTWYNALMDYGVMLKKRFGNPARRSAHHARQGRFDGSDRQARGAILRGLLRSAMGEEKLCEATGLPARRLRAILAGLAGEGMIAEQGGKYSIR